MADKLEKDIEEAAVMWLHQQGCYAIKLPSNFITGLPDRLILGPNRVIYFLEFKRTKKSKFQPLQPYWSQTLSGLGFGVYNPTSLQEVKLTHAAEKHKT